MEKLTKKEINEQLKEIRETIAWMSQKIKNNKLTDLKRDDFEDLMCLSTNLYYTFADAFDPE